MPTITCRTELLRQGPLFLASEPSLQYEWRHGSEREELYFPSVHPEGFDITLVGTDHDIELYAGGFHSSHDDNPDPADFLRHALGFVRDLLSPGMRLRELMAGGIAYRWLLESRRDSEWVVEEETGLLFWPYWASRSERIFVNQTLPKREP